MNLAFALERLEKLNVMLICGTTRPVSALAETGWDPTLLARISEVWLALPQLSAPCRRDPRNRLAAAQPARRAAAGCPPFLRRRTQRAAHASLARRLAGTADGGRRTWRSRRGRGNSAEDVARILQTELKEASEAPSLQPLRATLREARDAAAPLRTRCALGLAAMTGFEPSGRSVSHL